MEKKYKFISLFTGFKPVERSSFDEAFGDMFKYVADALDSRGMSWQELETCIWIESSTKGEVWFFYDARDRACRSGLMDKLKADRKSLKV